MALLLGHAASIPTYIPIAGALKHPDPADVHLMTFTIFEAAFVSICGAYLLGGLVKDRLAAVYWRASLVDPLTGVTNRRGFFEFGERLLRRVRLERLSAAAIMFDLDRFKQINDQFGHAIGDEVLVAFCRLAKDQLRPNDLFARIGGEEFVTFLPNTTSRDALGSRKRIRASIAAVPLAIQEQTIRATVSVGVAMLHEGMPELASLVREADQALYQAKANGRDRVEQTSAPPHHTTSNGSVHDTMQRRPAA